MSKLIMNALVLDAQAKEAKAIANLQNYMTNAAGIGEHPDILEAIEKELEVVARYHDQLEVLDKYFPLDED